MGAYLGSAVFSATLFFYFLGLIFVIVGYVGPWLEPKDGYGNEIESISVRMACFNDYEFPSKVGKIEYDSSGKLNRCVDTTKTSRTFKDVSDSRYVSPGWYREIQDMHLASLILMFFALVLSISFLVAYCMLKAQLKKRRRPSSALLLSKGGLALWFILPALVGILQLTEAIHFYIKYEENREDFFLTGERFRYGPGFAITIAGGVSLLVCAGLGCVIFCTVCRKMLRLSNGDAKMVFSDEFDNVDPNDTELERLSQDEAEDDNDKKAVIHRKAYPVAAPRRSTSRVDDEPKSYQNIPKPRNKSLHHESSEPSGMPYQNIPESRPHAAPRQSSASEASHQAPPAGMVPAYRQEATTPSVAAMSYVSTEAPSSVFTNSPYNRFQSDQYSDTDSTRSARNRTVAHSAGPSYSQRGPRGNVPEPKVVSVNRPTDVKHSKYAAY